MEVGPGVKDLSVIVPHYGSYPLLRNCLNGLREANTINPIVVEDGCYDSAIRDEFPEVLFKRLETNVGFAAACNHGLDLVETPFVAFLNNDVVVTEDWHVPVLRVLDSRPDVAVCQPKIKSTVDRDRFDYAGAAGGFLDRYGYPFCRGRVFDVLEVDRGQYDSACEVFWASGTAFVARTEDVRRAGAFDPLFFAYMEEIDLCWRLQALGKRIVYVPESEVFHEGSATWSSMSTRKTYLLHRNNLLLLIKNCAEEDLFSILLIRALMELASASHFLVRGELRVVGSIVRALAWNLTHFSDLRARLRLEESRKGIKRMRKGEMRGLYPHSIAFQHFLRGINRFSELQWEESSLDYLESQQP